MITVKYKPFELSVSGHAGYAREGHDIICAGASALLYALLGKLQAEGLLDYDNTNIGKGGAEIKTLPNADQRLCDIVFDTILQGYHSLAEHYPDYIRLESV